MAYIYDLTDTWNAGGTTFNAIKMNVTDSASASASKLVTLQTNGTEHFSVTKGGQGYFSGNVGIGTASPTAFSGFTTLELDSATNGGILSIKKAGSLVGYVNGSSGMLMLAQSNDLKLTTTGSTTMQFSTNGSERMRINASGNVGIGTSSPGTKLDVTGTTRSGNFRVNAGGTVTGAGMWGIDTILAFNTDSTERMRLDASGNVMVGTTSANSKFLVSYSNPTTVPAAGAGGHCAAFGTVGYGLAAGAITNGNAYLQATRWDSIATNHDLLLQPNGGNVGIGSTSPTGKLTVSNANAEGYEVNPTGGVGGGATVVTYNRSASVYTTRTTYSSAHTWFTGTAGSTRAMDISSSGNVGIGTSTPAVSLEVSSSFDEILRLSSTGSPYASWYAGATRRGYIQAQAGSFTVASDTAVPLILSTNSTERARIDASGNLLVGVTTSTGQGGVAFLPNSSNGACQILTNRATTASTSFIMDIRDGNTTVGSISHTNTATAFNTSSDVRLKHDIAAAPDASSLIDAIQVRSFKWNADNSEQRYGMIAQELLEVAPEAVSQPADPEAMMGVDYSKLVPMLVKEIQSLRARVAQLEGN